MLEQVKLLLGITDNSKDDILSLLIEQATEEALIYTHQNSIDNLLTAIVRMVVYNFIAWNRGVDSRDIASQFCFSLIPEVLSVVKKTKRTGRQITDEAVYLVSFTSGTTNWQKRITRKKMY